MSEEEVKIITDKGSYVFNGDTQIVINLKMFLTFISILIVLISTGYGILTSRIGKINTDITSVNTNVESIKGKVDVLSGQVGVLLNIYGNTPNVAKPVNVKPSILNDNLSTYKDKSDSIVIDSTINIFIALK